MSAPVRVLVVDDHPTFRDGVRSVLAAVDGVEVVAGLGTGEDAVAHCVADPPDVVLLDLLMPGFGGLEAARRLRERCPEVAVVVLTMSDTDESMYAALRLGARGYLLKDSPGDAIVDAVLRASAGHALYDRTVADRIAAWFSAGPRPHPFPELTERERDVLALLADGLDNQAIAQRLLLARKTVRNNVSSVLAKLGCSTRGEAAARARGADLGTRTDRESRAGQDPGHW